MSDDEFLSYGSDSGNEYDADSDIESVDDIYDDVIGEEPTTSRSDQKTEDDYPYEVLSTEQIVQDMVNSIKEVNHVIQIPTTTVRILLNHFKWDKEKLMERYYSDDPEAIFAEAKVVSPHRKASSKSCTKSSGPGTFECEICYLTLPKAVSVYFFAYFSCI